MFSLPKHAKHAPLLATPRESQATPLQLFVEDTFFTRIKIQDLELNIFVLMRLSDRSRLRGRGLEDLAEPLDRAPQLGWRLYTHFAHHLSAMRFDRALGDAEEVGDLLVREAAHNERIYLALA